ncbi:MAG: IMPACT family protein [Gammaproteobacteria bacterium]
MHCVKSIQSCEELIKKSRFIGVVVPCGSEQDVTAALKKLFEQHPHATHIAFAYRIKSAQGMIYRFHDAGEPTGTAGKPIYQHIEGKQLINVLVAVIRYFGGVKLGAGGLTRAYGGCAKKVIEAAELVEYVEYATLAATLNYGRLQAFGYHVRKLGGEIVNQHFGVQVEVEVRLPAAHADELQRFLDGRTEV